MAGPHNIKQAVETRVFEKALKDDSFREALIKDPKTAIENEIGVKLPGNVNIHINENTASDIYLSIPAKSSSEQLTNAELTGVAGGWAAPCIGLVSTYYGH